MGGGARSRSPAVRRSDRWYQYRWPLLVTTDRNYATASIELGRLVPSAAYGDRPVWNTAMAGTLIVMVPPLIVVILLQRWFVRGLVASEKQEGVLPEILIRGLRKSYGKLETLHGVDLAFASREFVVILGPSGCGKSTLLRMIAGLESVTAGEISIGDRGVNRLKPRERGCAMVFQPTRSTRT